MTTKRKVDEKSVDAPNGILRAARSTHESNKKEAFEGMRAYHQSEINHKKDAIAIFQTLISSTVFIYTGLTVAVYNHLSNDNDPIVYLAWYILIVLTICSSGITYLTNRKIRQDNSRYKVYADEYSAERYLLNLEKDLLDMGYESYWFRAKNNKMGKYKDGHHYTKRIIVGLNIIVCFMGVIGTASVVGAANYHIKVDSVSFKQGESRSTSLNKSKPRVKIDTPSHK